MPERLFGVERTGRWRGSRALVPLSVHLCPACGYALDETGMGQLALFFHGGYGATQRSTRRHCHGCGWTLLASVADVNPRVHAAS
jgi:hypothetical protein